MKKLLNTNWKKEPCIYKITVNGNLYIGSTKNAKSREMNHYYLLNKNKHHAKYMQHSYNKYEDFEFEVIEYMINSTVTERLIKEKYYIDLLKPKFNVIQDPVSPSEEDRKRISTSIKKAYAEGRLINPWAKRARNVDVYDYTGLLLIKDISTEEAVTYTEISNRSVINNSIRTQRYIVKDFFVVPTGLDFIDLIKEAISKNSKFYSIYKIDIDGTITKAHNQGRFYEKLNDDYYYKSETGAIFCRKGLLHNAVQPRNR